MPCAGGEPTARSSPAGSRDCSVSALESLIDICHNAVVPFDGGWLHRKGATPHDQGPVVIPGSRGALSYLVVPTGDGAGCGHSLAHGAGRKWSRSEARERMRERFRSEALLRTPLGNPVICEDRSLLFEEAPQAYKKSTAWLPTSWRSVRAASWPPCARCSPTRSGPARRTGRASEGAQRRTTATTRHEPPWRSVAGERSG